MDLKNILVSFPSTKLLLSSVGTSQSTSKHPFAGRVGAGFTSLTFTPLYNASILAVFEGGRLQCMSPKSVWIVPVIPENGVGDTLIPLTRIFNGSFIYAIGRIKP